MKRLITISVTLLFVITSSIGQTRVTSFKDPNQMGRTFVKEVNGVNYLIRITTKDEIKVSKVIDENTFELISSTTINNIGSNTNLMIYGTKVVIPSDIGIYTYDFLTKDYNGVTGMQGGIVVGEKTIHGSKESVVVKGKFLSNPQTAYFLIGNMYFVSQLPEKFEPLYVTDKCVFGVKKISSSQREFYIWEPSKNRLEILLDASNHHYGVDVIGDKAWYLDNDNEIFNIDLSTFERKATGITASLNKTFKQVLVQQNEAIIYQGTSDSLFLEKVDLVTKQKKQLLKFKINGGIDTKNFHWRGNIIYYRTLNGELGCIDLVNTTKVSIQAAADYTFIDFPIIDNRYIYVTLDNTVQYLDITTNEKFSTTPAALPIKGSSPGVIKIGNQLLSSFVRSNTLSKNIFKTDLTSKKIDLASVENFITDGLEDNISMINYGDKMYTIAQNLYSIDGVNATLSNTCPVDLHDYLKSFYISGDRIFYHSTVGDSISLHSVSGNSDTQVLKVKKTTKPIDYFGVTDKYFYFLDGADKFYQVDLLTSEITQLTNYENSKLGSLGFVAFKNSLYFRVSNTLIKLDDDGTFDNLINSTYGYFIESGKYTYYATETALYLCTDEGITTIFDGGIQYFSSLRIPDSEDLFFISNFDRKLFKVSGSEVEFYQYDQNGYITRLSIENLGKHFAIIKDQYSAISILDYKSGQYNQVEDIPELNGKSLVSVIVMKSDTLIYVSSGTVISTYKASNYFKDITLIHVKDINVILEDPSFVVNDDYGLLQSVDHLFYITKTGELIPIVGLVSSSYTQFTTVKTDKFIYFLGIENIWGRQVYAIDNDDFNSVDTKNTVGDRMTDLSIQPNISQDFISIKGYESLIPDECKILGSDGKVLKQLNTTSLIDIGNFTPGLYYVQIVYNQRIVNLPFIKL